MLDLGLTPEQKAARVGKIGASNTPGILGLSPWSSPIQEWARIMEPSEDDIRTDAMTVGLLFEPAIVAWFAAERGLEVGKGWTMQHPDLPYIVATPDGVVRDEGTDYDVPLECKFVSARQASKWLSTDGLYRAPDYVRAQNIHQQIVMAVRRGYIVACIVGLEGVKLHWEPVTSTEEEQASFLERLQRFHDEYMATSTPPAPDASARATELLVKRHPKSDGTWLTPTDEDEALRLTRQMLADKSSELKREIDAIDNQIRARIGDAVGIEGIARWSDRAGTINYRTACTEAGMTAEFLAKYRGASTRMLKWE